jgi:hypothetical protein
MISVGLWQRYINITIAILGIIHRPVFYLEHDNSGNWLSPFLGGTHSQTSSIYWTQMGRFYLKVETESSLNNVVLNKRQDDG